jgi:putative toxin-antitoxin system antitoxin component (TIGR02293 family)
MNVMSRAKVYEELKELRRQGGMDSEIQGVQGRFAALIKGLDAVDVAPDDSASAVRILDIRTLADRVFGDENKADAWLHRPNTALSGQEPIDLLKDELGAAVVREMLERIDHGIFA